jgi:hypothetical protein
MFGLFTRERLASVESGSGLKEVKEEVVEFIRSFFEVGKSEDLVSLMVDCAYAADGMRAATQSLLGN